MIREVEKNDEKVIWEPGETIEDLKKRVILAALRHYGNNRIETSKGLGICVRTLRDFIRRNNLRGSCVVCHEELLYGFSYCTAHANTVKKIIDEEYLFPSRGGRVYRESPRVTMQRRYPDY